MSTNSGYRKIGKFGVHTIIEQQADCAVILCCTSAGRFGGVSITEPALAQFTKLPREQKFILLRSITGGWSEFFSLNDLPYMVANQGRVGDDGKRWADYRIYDHEDVPNGTIVEPVLLEFIKSLEERKAALPF